MAHVNAPVPFPCQSIPDSPALARLLGLYPQRQEGLWMQRVKVPGGLLTGGQWRILARIARELSPQTPLHLTTRQDIELHDLTPDRVPAAQQLLAEAGLSTVGACGDTPRNVTVCPCSGILPGRPDLHPLAERVHGALQAIDGAFALPRKFKVSFSCGPTCGQPWINDLGLVAERRGGEWGFQAVAAGSLGPRPATGIVLLDWLEARDAPALAVAAVTLFAAHGDREHRAKARLRHVRERLGEEPFRRMLLAEFERARKSLRDETVLHEPSEPLPASRELTFPNGDLWPAQAEALADLAQREDLRVRIGNPHRVIVFGPSAADVAGALGAWPALFGPARRQPSVVACPGNRWCSRGLTDTNRLADAIRTELSRQLSDLPEDSPLARATVCISGCPNGCAHSAVADVGLTGGLMTPPGNPSDQPAGESAADPAAGSAERIEGYNLSVGGGMGRDARLAEPLARRLPFPEAVAAVLRHLAK